ncbi:MAG: carboxypeptidase-like regulatory domain-containing protein [Acidobacteriota bacterium]
MRRLVHILVRKMVIGGALGAVAFGPGFCLGFSGFAGPTVEAAPVLAFVSGTVKDEGGQPLTGAVVALLEAAFNGREIKSVKTDAEGKFTAAINPGAYRLRAAAEGFKPVLARVLLDPAAKVNYDFALKRDDTLVDKRGDRDDYRWIGRSVPRHVLHLDEEAPPPVQSGFTDDRQTEFRPSFHGMMQLLAVNSLAGSSVPGGQGFYGTNFAVAGTFGGNFEMAVIAQRGAGALAPQRVEAIATVRPWATHQITASVGYGQVPFTRRALAEPDMTPEIDPTGTPGSGGLAANAPGSASGIAQRGVAAGRSAPLSTIDQLSLSAVGQWQVFQPLLVIYGFDYARFVGSSTRHQESILPRLAFQFEPAAGLRLKAGLTPGSGQNRIAPEGFESEDIDATFETQAPEIAAGDEPLIDRSRRLEFGFERVVANGSGSIEAAAFYDIVSRHGIGVVALPLEATSETQAAFQRVANQVQSMNGAARGLRVMYAQRLGDQVTASFGYSFGRGQRFDESYLSDLRPSHLLRSRFFQVATAKLDLDFTAQTGTHISTVVRLSPQAVVFAIDPFAGQMSVYDPNINIYVTQELPNLGLPFRWQALVDIRNLLNQLNGVDDGTVQLVSARSYRTVRGGVSFRW